MPHRAPPSRTTPTPPLGESVLRDWRANPNRILVADWTSSFLSGLLFERRFGLVHQRAKRRRVGERHIGQNFAVQLHAGFFKAIHELAVGDFSRAAGRPDAHDPQ